MSGPYFPGQQPAPCGHFFPDVLRMKDVGKLRHLNCRVCGDYTTHIDIGMAGGPETWTDPGALERIRAEEMARLAMTWREYQRRRRTWPKGGD